MNTREMQEVTSLVGDIIGASAQNAIIMQKRIQRLKSGLQTIVSCGDRLSQADIVYMAKSVLEEYDKMP